MDKRVWFVVVMAKHDDGYRVIASCLTVSALNKFQAKVKAGEMIRSSDEYRKADGEVRPYTVTEITLIRIKDIPAHQARFVEAFQSVFVGGEIASRNVYVV